MKFIGAVCVAVALAIAGLFLPHNLVTISVFGTSLVAWVAGLLIMVFSAIYALWEREKFRSNFDMVAASEVIVVFGIFGLLSSLAFGAVQSAPLIDAGLSGKAIDLRTLIPLVYRFAEGLLAAGIAPVVAVVLRQVESLMGKPKLVDVVVDPKELEREFKGLELSLKGLNREVEGMMTRFGGSAGRLTDAVNGLNAAISASATTVEASGRQLGNAMSSGATGLSGSLDVSVQKITELHGALARLKQELDEVVPGTRNFGAQGQAAAKVLDELVVVISSVRNFIHGPTPP
jgi:hypothetical protein